MAHRLRIWRLLGAAIRLLVLSKGAMCLYPTIQDKRGRFHRVYRPSPVTVIALARPISRN